MNVKSYNLGLIVLIPFIFIVYFGSVYFFYFDNKDDSFSVQTYFNYKDSIVKSSIGNKILFTSGSNNFLGIRAYKVKKRFDVPAFNLSIHAGLKTEYILERVKRIVHKGDIVIVPFEYSNLVDNEEETSIVLNKYLLSYDKEYFNQHFDLVNKFKLLSSISVIDLLSSLFNTKDSSQLKKEKERLLINLNRNGDMLNMVKHDSLKTKKPPFRLPEYPFSETKALKVIKKFNIYCEEKGICFFMTFPNIVDLETYNKGHYQEYFTFLIKYFNDNDIKYLGTPKQGRYPQELFFDSEYHLISKGSDIRTEDFIEILDKTPEFIYCLKKIKVNFSNE